MFGKSLAIVAAVLPFGLFADWESDSWMRLSDVAFETYQAGDRLDVTNGARHGHWESDDEIAVAGSAMETINGTMYMHLETTNLTFVSERPGRAGGGNVLLFSLQTRARADLPGLPSGSKGGFAVATDDANAGEVSFYGWAAGGWRELRSDKISPSKDLTWYDCAMRFRVTDTKAVEVQYFVKGAGGYEVLTLPAGGDGWLDTGLTNGDATVSAVDFNGVGGLERLSTREKNGFSVRLR